ncbi:centromere protein F isoform X1 [Etheostoma spectabile]|uniref:centromere protein F isoform X1 n=1 Tax=Etheostoma spectabile TaxID=54343 RepID=UPI0013AFDEA0|nr:centromere protein F-like isoform X1 [Etheostoma spectabile]XP_032383844.1 centromere protein F-like isoform X1 [Etheostoma spectabile]XP_032383845.1 centromere protein F-like isoform X1 [Etheostoma spectabile]XP_032383847.1 centromere protein F-like isoform X1 [Etheostoma spectabile]
MSWAEEDWTVGLSGRVLQKVKELQVHQERLSRENKQKQLQLDNIHTSLEKQTVKYEEVRGELQCVQRELQSVRQEAKAAVTSSDRLTQELQIKQAQVCSLEGQRDAARTLNNKLTQEIKRLEAELENLQNSSRLADTTLFSTPCWNTTSPWEHNGSRKQERSEHRDERPSRPLHIRQQLQFSEGSTASLPRHQNNSTPHRHPSDQSDTFSSTPLSAFPWERDDSRPAARRPSPSAPQTPCTAVISKGQQEQRVYGKEKDHRTETDTSLSEVLSRVSALEEELGAKAGMLKSVQNEMVQSKKELTARELSLQKARDELSLAHTGMAQERERASGSEQRLKQLQEELKCQRQNAESSRLQHQQRSKELEKQHQRDLTELQKERQCLEKQHQQEVNKLNQELQQARTLHNALQAQADKLSLQKQALDKELDTLKEKLKWTEGQLQECQKKEAQTQAKLTEALREAEGVAMSLEQSRKRERGLEEEGRRLAEERADTLRLLKELQAQQTVPAPPQQPVQFCPVGQSFSPQTSYSLHSRPSTHIKGPSTATLAEQKREEDVDKRRAEIAASYPSDREPGEGIDSEDISNLISPASERLQREHRRRSNDENRNEAIESDSSGTNEHSTFDQVVSTSSHSAAGMPTNTSMDGSSENTPLKAFEDLKRENATLRSELYDAREELQKRLEDLEAQRQAETEARTRLKQLSRKRASQAVDKDEKEKEWRAQLESERTETERLRKAMLSLETEMKREREEIERKEREEEEEKNKALEDRESKLIELNIQLKKQLVEVKAKLALEQEERKREEEERNQINTDIDVKEELSKKLEELQAELEELKCGREEDSLEEDKLSVANSQLTYLTLHDDDDLNSNIVRCDNKLLPSPEMNLLFCQSTNQRNILVSQATADLIQEERTVIDPECSVLEDDRQNYLKGSSVSDHKRSLSDLQKVEPAFSDLTKEVERLTKENTKERERANQYQVKLEALQSQVTCQTKQLTTAFEKQSQYISGLLVELQEKESTRLIQGEELQHYKQELDALKAEKEGAEKKRRDEMTVKVVEDGEQKKETKDERLVEISRLQANQEKKSAVNLLTSNSPADGYSDAQKDTGQLEIVTPDQRLTPYSDKSDSEALWSGEQHPSAQPKTQSNHDSACVMGETECSQETANVVAELLVLQRENQLLKQRIEGLTVSDTRTPLLHTDSEDQEDPATQSQNTGNAALACLVEQRSLSVPNDITTDARQLLVQDVKRREDGRITKAEELEAASELQTNRLQQQVEELQMRLRTLSAETQQQAGELLMWKLASQPAPTFDQFLSNTDKPSKTLDQISAVRQSQSNQQAGQVQVQDPYLGVQESPGNVTVVREDELFFSCTSNKLQGCMLFSRLQHSNLFEPKNAHPSKKTAALQEYDQESAMVDKESEKENLEINLLHQSNTCQSQHKEERDTEVIQMISEKMGQPNATQDSHKVSGPKRAKSAECYTGNPEAKSDASRATNEINNEINKTIDSSDRYVREEMKSVSSQTEESLYPRSAPTASELHCAYTQTEEEEEKDEEELVKSPPVSHVSPVPLCEGAELGDKMLFSGSFPIPADPARLAERIRRNRTQLSAAFDDTEYEPYGLPEVVMKGFADIPSGPSCPYIVRRGLLGTSVVPVPPKDPRQEEETD